MTQDAFGKELNITSSSPAPKQKTRGKSSTHKYFISIDSLRLIAYSLEPEDEMYDPNSYSVHSYYYKDSHRTKYTEELVDFMRESEDNIVYLLPGSYSKERLISKK